MIQVNAGKARPLYPPGHWGFILIRAAHSEKTDGQVKSIQHLTDSACRPLRCAYRLEYPELLRPALRVGTREFPVLDISENGLRVALPSGAQAPDRGYRLAGTIHLQCGLDQVVVGAVYRAGGEEMVILFDHDGIAFEVIAHERSAVIAQAS